MRYPNFLKEGDTIGFVAPSFGCVIEPYHTLFDHTLSRMEEWGFRTKLGPNVYADNGVGISSTPILCGKEMNEAYADDEIKALIACGGGELMCETVSFMDFDSMKQASPKWFLGYSDNTNFTFLSTTLMDTAALYGPCAPEFGQEPMHESLFDFMDFMCGKKLSFHSYDKWELNQLKDAEHPLASYNLTEVSKPISVQYKGPVSGRLLGGCLDCLVNICGTRFDKVKEFNERYAEDGVIWFLESCELNAMSIRRSLWNLKEAGWFDCAKAFVIGRPGLYGSDVMGLDQNTAVTGLLGEFGVPIILDVDLGHLPPRLPFLSGAFSTVEIKDEKFYIAYELK